jgi:hypothetical protein
VGIKHRPSDDCRRNSIAECLGTSAGWGRQLQPSGPANGSQPFRSGDKSNVTGGWLPSLTFAFGHICRVRKKLVIFAIAVTALVGAGWLASRPPANWSRVSLGMSRSSVYSLIGTPVINNESTKGGVRWRSGAVVGRWEFDVFFRADDTVAVLGKRWRWNWW